MNTDLGPPGIGLDSLNPVAESMVIPVRTTTLGKAEKGGERNGLYFRFEYLLDLSTLGTGTCIFGGLILLFCGATMGFSILHTFLYRLGRSGSGLYITHGLASSSLLVRSRVLRIIGATVHVHSYVRWFSSVFISGLVT